MMMFPIRKKRKKTTTSSLSSLCVHHTVAVGMLCATVVGCSDYELDERSTPETQTALVVEPLALSLGPVALGDTDEGQVALINQGSRTLSIQHVGVVDGTAFTVSSPSLMSLSPGAVLPLTVSYTAQGTADQGTLWVVTDDTIQPEVRIPLTGTAAIPVLQFDPNPLVLATATTAAQSTARITLHNAGDASLDVNAVLLSGEGFSLVDSNVPVTLAPGEETWADVSFSRSVAGLYQGVLWTQDSTPAGTSSAGLLGASAVPVALCSVYPARISPIHETADWLDGGSFDAAEEPIVAHHWTLVEQPTGSAATLEADGANVLAFTPDLAGIYVAELVVETQSGRLSAPCAAQLEAIPNESLWVEMFWSLTGDDMDLHVLRPDGELLTDGDCHYDNCIGGRLDWGVAGVSSDDPNLDMDDIAETGPENVNILQPESGVFSIYVHDYPTSESKHSGSNAVTVNIFLGGEQAWTGTKDVAGEDTFTEFATVDWPSGVITPVP